MSFSRAVFLFFSLFLLCACHRENAAAEHSFYYWKTTIDNDTAAERKIAQLGIDHFYIHYMDVDWSENLGIPVPQGSLSIIMPQTCLIQQVSIHLLSLLPTARSSAYQLPGLTR